MTEQLSPNIAGSQEKSSKHRQRRDETGALKSPREMVAKACERCRRLKLKCSESWPCMRCTKKRDPNCCSDCGPFGNRQSDSSQWRRAWVGAEPILPGLQLSNTNYPNFPRQQHLDRPLHYVNNSHFVTSPLSFSQALCAPPSHDTPSNFRSQPQTRPLEFGLRHVGEMVQPVISTLAQRPQSEESWIASRRELLSGGFSYSHAEVRHVSKPPPVALDLGHSCPIPPAAQRPSPTGAALTEAELKAQWLSREMGESPPLP